MPRLPLFPFLLALTVSLSASDASRADDRYYLMVFGSQTHPALVRYTHTYGTFVHVSSDESQGTCNLEVVTISWLPRSLILHPLSPRPKPGVNLDLISTFNYALCNREMISMWGPYEICPELFCKAVQRKAYLESGQPEYNVVDRIRRPLVLDCIHALSGVDHDPGRLHTRTAYGDIASYFVLHHFGRFIIHPEVTHDWVAERLGVWCYPIWRRGYCEVPRSVLPILPPNYTQRQAPLIRPRFRLGAEMVD